MADPVHPLEANLDPWGESRMEEDPENNYWNRRAANNNNNNNNNNPPRTSANPAAGPQQEVERQIDPIERVYRWEEEIERNRKLRVDELQRHFNFLLDYEFESVVGSGSFGVACRIVQKDYKGQPRKLIIKRAVDDTAAPELRHEINIMLKLNGSVHIANVIATRDDCTSMTVTRGVLRRIISRVLLKPDAFLIGLRGPVLVLENLENGTLEKFLYSVVDSKKKLPNRVLWHFFLCFVRACQALETPPNRLPDSELWLETPSDDLDPAQSIMHNDIHMANVLIGSAGDFPEHALIPPLKLIDFGMATNDANATDQNLTEVCSLMLYLITGWWQQIEGVKEPYERIETRAGVLLEKPRGLPFPKLDPDLRRLLIYCLANEKQHRPTLAELLRQIQHFIATKTPESYGEDAAIETDEAIKSLLEDIIYNADFAHV
ncbi:kinase-like domain-containing protein [Xylaria nigripes]|nr:kinase-like domain-containing protein [Xylaria nigripes]